MNVLNKNIKNDIIKDKLLITKITSLLEYDNKFKEIGDKMISKLNQETIEKWDTVMGRLAELQGLVILKKISKNDSHIIIDSLLNALDNKFRMINFILDDTYDNNNKDDTNDNNKNLKGGSINNVKKSIIYLINKNKILNFIKNNI